MNKCIFTGRLGQDPDGMQYLPSGSAVLKLRIAVDTGFGDKKHTDWVPLTAFGKNAENIAKFCKKGTLVEVDSTYRTSQWETSEGEKRYGHEFIVERWRSLHGGKTNEEVAESGNGSDTSADSGADPDFGEFPF